MIDKWVLDNFKSINQEQELPFRPLTIFTGANSSGKSTILQSILLVTQTLQSPIASRSILLNGWFKKFGSYSDVVNLRDYQKNIKIGFSLIDDTADLRNDYFTRHRFQRGVERTDCSFVISSDGKNENLHPVLEEMQMEVYSGKERMGFFDIIKGIQKTDEEKKVIESCRDKYQPSDFLYSISTDIKNRYGYYGYRENWKSLGMGLFHFLPNYTIEYSSYKDQIKNILSDYLLSGRSTSYYDIEQEDEKIIIPLIKEKALSIVDDIYNKKKFRDLNTFKKKYELINRKLTINRLQKVFQYSTIDGDEKQKYVRNILDLLDALPERYITERMPMYYNPGIDFVKEFFNNHILYLGPLREEPRSLYPLESNGSTSDLGLKGENTAAVFENNKSKMIAYIDPDFFARGAEGRPFSVVETLEEAINKWLVYLGVAKKMSTNDRGKFGHELKITTDVNEMKQDLTHVGVGVSQILPILVLCFLSRKGDSIILEQPELHLHPKVQARLADFFVSMNALGKQCIIETHSEYLINRLRYLVAKTDESKIADQTMIYFVEKDQVSGASRYRQITINPYGVIEQWPDGFFDEGEDLATKIVKAGMEKKRREFSKRI